MFRHRDGLQFAEPNPGSECVSEDVSLVPRFGQLAYEAIYVGSIS